MSMRGSRSIRSVVALSAATATALVLGARPTTAATNEMVRLAGTDRIQTSIAVSQHAWKDADSASVVVLARSDNFPDALAGVPLAATASGPLLLTPPTALEARTKAEIDRVLPQGAVVYLLGSTSALSASVENAVRSAGYTVERLWGGDRFATAAAIADEIVALDGAEMAILATGMNYPDALAAGPAAGTSTGGVVLLTKDGTMPAATQTFITGHPSMTIYTVGAPAKAAYPSAPNISGSDRYATATEVAKFFWNGVRLPRPVEFGLATGSNFPDALSGGAMSAAFGAPMLLTAQASLSPATQTYLAANKADLFRGFVFGSTSVVSDTTKSQALTAIT